MTKSILISLAVLTLSASTALAAQRTHHRQAANANAPVSANAFGSAGASPVVWTGGASSADHATYMKNLHDAGYDPKNNFNANGTIKTQ
jgi:hypothetical protein